MNEKPKLLWEEKYSVGVEELDNQHKVLFQVINEMVDLVGLTSTKEKINGIGERLGWYINNHFATEEKYFKMFHYVEAEEHVLEHKIFHEKIDEIQKKYNDDTLTLSFQLVDYLEDWWIHHIMIIDKKYKNCFQKHGLK